MYSDLNEVNAMNIVESLKKNGYQYKLSEDRKSILVPSKLRYDMQIFVAQNDLIKTGDDGFELLDDMQLGSTDFKNKLTKQRIFQGEITRAIQRIQGIKFAKVQLAEPERSIFEDTDEKPSASVMLVLQPGVKLKSSQVKAIKNLVAYSVPRLSPEQVFITDQNGNVLSDETSKNSTESNLGIVKVKISDGTGNVYLNFFTARPSVRALERMKQQFPKYSGIMVSGKVKFNSYDKVLTLDKPTYSLTEDETFIEDNNLNMARIVPIYPLVENLNIKTLRKAIWTVLLGYYNEYVSPVPDYIAEKYHLLPKNDALKQIHFPHNQEKLDAARFTLIFEEFFLLQLHLALVREENNKRISSVPLKIKKDGLVMKW